MLGRDPRSKVGAMAPRITVVNDNPEFLELVRDILEDEHYATTTIDEDFENASERVVESRPELLILDLRLGTDDLRGWHIAQEVRTEPSLEGLPVIICSADVLALEALADELANSKQVRTLSKPFTIAELTTVIDGMLAEAASG
jgi:CheY-like chemotaxis protein